MQTIPIREHRYLIGFTLLYMGVAAFAYLLKGSWEFLTYLAVVLLGGFLLLSTLRQTRLSTTTLWLISIGGILHMACGIIPVGDGILFNWEIIEIINKGDGFYILRMDQVVHFYGYCVAAIAFHQGLSHRMSHGSRTGILVFLATTGAMGIGAFNEVMEYLATIIYARTKTGGFNNMGLDLIFNFAGALLGAIGENLRYNRNAH